MKIGMSLTSSYPVSKDSGEIMAKLDWRAVIRCKSRLAPIATIEIPEARVKDQRSVPEASAMTPASVGEMAVPNPAPTDISPTAAVAAWPGT